MEVVPKAQTVIPTLYCFIDIKIFVLKQQNVSVCQYYPVHSSHLSIYLFYFTFERPLCVFVYYILYTM